MGTARSLAQPPRGSAPGPAGGLELAAADAHHLPKRAPAPPAGGGARVGEPPPYLLTRTGVAQVNLSQKAAQPGLTQATTQHHKPGLGEPSQAPTGRPTPIWEPRHRYGRLARATVYQETAGVGGSHATHSRVAVSGRRIPHVPGGIIALSPLPWETSTRAASSSRTRASWLWPPSNARCSAAAEAEDAWLANLGAGPT
jgi:hypothetical protein